VATFVRFGTWRSSDSDVTTRAAWTEGIGGSSYSVAVRGTGVPATATRRRRSSIASSPGTKGSGSSWRRSAARTRVASSVDENGLAM